MDFPYLIFLDRQLEKKTEVLGSLAQASVDIETIEKAMRDFLSKVTTWHRREYKPVLGIS